MIKLSDVGNHPYKKVEYREVKDKETKRTNKQTNKDKDKEVV